MKNESPVIEKLRKLIAHERSARTIGNLDEAAAFASKIQDMLDAHKLSMSEVDIQEREANEPVSDDVIDWAAISGRKKKVRVYWHLAISSAIAEANDCQRVGQQGNDTIFFFIGRESNREIAKILYIYFIELGEHLCAKSAKEERDDQMAKFAETNGIPLDGIPLSVVDDLLQLTPHLKKGFNKWMSHYKNSWYAGFGDSIAKRIRARIAQTPGTDGALVHIKRDALAIRQYLAEFGTMKPSKIHSNVHNIDGVRAGTNMGGLVNLSPNTFSGAKGRASRLLGS